MEGTGVGLLRPLGTIALLTTAFLVSSCQFIDLKVPECEGCGQGAKICKEPTVRALAHDVDELEKHIERNGSVVAKQPDVWGQARLTKAREEFEKEMLQELDNFTLTLQGSLSRSDQAYFASAMALGVAASGQAAGVAPPTRVAVSTSTSNTVVPTVRAHCSPGPSAQCAGPNGERGAALR